jgi:hypothetical protein
MKLQQDTGTKVSSFILVKDLRLFEKVTLMRYLAFSLNAFADTTNVLLFAKGSMILFRMGSSKDH